MAGRFSRLEFNEPERQRGREESPKVVGTPQASAGQYLAMAHQAYRWGRFENALQLYTRTLRENRQLHLHRPAVRQLAVEAHASTGRLRRGAGHLQRQGLGRSSGDIGGSRGAQLDKCSGYACRVGDVGVGDAPGLTVGAAGLQRQPHRRAGQRQRALLQHGLAGHEQGDAAAGGAHVAPVQRG